MPRTTVIIPTYNEAENLPLMVEALLALNLDNFHITVVDDNSPDGTGKIGDLLASQHKGKITILHNPHKGGLGLAYKLGFKHAMQQGFDYMIQMDCDFSHQPKYVPQLIDKANEGFDIVQGSRYVKGGGVDERWGWYRKFLSWFANRVYVRTILGLPINDATAGFRLWRRATLIGMDLSRINSNGYVFQVEIAYVAHRLGYSIAEVPIYFPDRERGESKLGAKIMLEAAIRVWQMRYRHQNLTAQKRAVEKV